MQRETRMKRELTMLESDPPPGISCWIVNDQLDHLQATILGNDDTPYAGGLFKLNIHIPERYPFQPPKVQFITPIYHPNIDNAGRICLDNLKMPPKGGWKPSWNVATVLKSIQSLMAEPNPEDPLMAEISEQFKLERSEFNKTAEEWTKKYALSDVRNPERENIVLSDKTNSNEQEKNGVANNKRRVESSLSPRKVIKYQ